MLISTYRTGDRPPQTSEITPQAVYRARRALMQQAAAGALGVALAGWTGRQAMAQSPRSGQLAPLATQASKVAGAMTMEKPTSYQDATSYNNFYEFGTRKQDPSRHASSLQTRPWAVQVDGLVAKPRTISIEDLLKLSAMEHRVYRLRCVEGWSMVIPWVGYSFSQLFSLVQPLGSAKFVEFVTLADAKQMPGMRSAVLQWPYVEALRIDEAMHPLTLLAFGMYGEVLPNQNGAPVRLVVPWKYGFKSAKSIVRIRLVEKQPTTSWMRSVPDEYGFYSNVNPNVDHPRWSQATERRIGEGGLFAPKRKTLLFNGYEAQVGHLYVGMDLKKCF